MKSLAELRLRDQEVERVLLKLYLLLFASDDKCLVPSPPPSTCPGSFTHTHTHTHTCFLSLSKLFPT